MGEKKISGIGPDAPIVENDQGGRQSALPYKFSTVPPLALMRMVRVFTLGAEKYGPKNYKKIPLEDSVDQAMAHLAAYLAGDDQDDHLGHALARLVMAVDAQENAITPE